MLNNWIKKWVENINAAISYHVACFHMEFIFWLSLALVDRRQQPSLLENFWRELLILG